MTDILIVGGGGREHALAWKLRQSPRVGDIYIAPGNGGTALLGRNVPIAATDIVHLAAFAAEKKIGLTIVGPDDPLALGIVDAFRSRGLLIFGPTQEAAQIEASKAAAKEFMIDGKIPTAKFGVFDSPERAIAHLRVRGAPVVVKASGLALGKGVYVCQTLEEAERAVDEIMVKRVHKGAGDQVVIEDCLEGAELSIHAITDGVSYALFPPAQDHKRALEGDQGENTGGMGAIAPVSWAVPEMSRIDAEIVGRAFETFKRRGIDYRGVLYPGIMMNAAGPSVLEFNARFGDPECQVYMRLMQSDLLDLLEGSARGDMTEAQKAVQWSRGYAVNIVLASGGYPGRYERGFPITGIEDAEKIAGVVVFHAGTMIEGEQFVTAGGRVLGVSAVGSSLQEALASAYNAIGKISFERMYYRKDIGSKSLG